MDIKGNAWRERKVFSDDGKERISIVISLDFTQDVSRIKHRKPGSRAASQFDGVLSSDRHLRVDGRTIAASDFNYQKRFRILPTFRCFFLDETWVQSKKLTIRILLFPSMEKNISL